MSAAKKSAAIVRTAQPAGKLFGFAGLGLAVILVAAYARTFSAPFVFDDITAIQNNPSIRSLGSFEKIVSPPPGTTVSGRPVVNFTLALNHAISGLDPWSYHALNFLIHAAAGVLLFGVVRRTLTRLAGSDEPASRETWLAFTTTALWLLHPLQTESVTYVVQRAEALMTFFYLLTLYAFIRSVTSPAPRRWLVGSFVACLLGMATKEVMVSAPLVVLLYSRTFIAGSWREAWRRHGGFVVALASTWVLLGALVLTTGGRGGTAGLGSVVTPWTYALTQCGAIVRYFALSVWPNPLVFDYGTDWVTRVSDAALPGLVVVAALAATGWALARRPVIGFAAASFFLLLAPTSSFVPIATQAMAEHRMYLPLAAVIVMVVVAAHRRVGGLAIGCGLGVAVIFGFLTWRRNGEYRDVLTLWADTAAKRPTNARAHCNLANALSDIGRKAEAETSYRRSLQLDPVGLEAHDGIAALLLESGRADEARVHFETALKLDPDPIEVENRRGALLARAGQAAEALPHFEAALKQKPERTEFHTNYGAALLQLGRTDEAVAEFEAALRLQPDFIEAHADLALVFLQAGRLAEAAAHYAAVLRVAPGDAVAHGNLGYIAMQQGKGDEAVAHYREAARINASEPGAHLNLGHALLRTGQADEARAEYETALRLDPENAAAQAALARMRGR